MAVFAVTEQSVSDDLVGATRTFVGGSKTTAYSLLDTADLGLGFEAEGVSDALLESESAAWPFWETGLGWGAGTLLGSEAGAEFGWLVEPEAGEEGDADGLFALV
jgi:hypothetical protein